MVNGVACYPTLAQHTCPGAHPAPLLYSAALNPCHLEVIRDVRPQELEPDSSADLGVTSFHAQPPMRSIAIINQKGGVGKTTTAVNLSAALAASGKRIGLVDLDPQAHASLHLGLGPHREVPNVYEVLTGNRPLAEVWQAAEPNLWVAPSHIDLAAAEVELAGVVGRELILRDALAEAAAVDGQPFDYVIIDCPPSLGILTINALAAVDEVFLPLQPHYLALHGLSKLLQTIDLVRRRLNERLRLAGVVLCLFESGTRLAAEVSADVEKFFGDAAGAPTSLAATCTCSPPASAATSAWPKPPASSNRSSATPKPPPAPTTTAPSPTKSSPSTTATAPPPEKGPRPPFRRLAAGRRSAAAERVTPNRRSAEASAPIPLRIPFNRMKNWRIPPPLPLDFHPIS